MKTGPRSILTFPPRSSSAHRRALQRELLGALRNSELPVILDLSACLTLDHHDIDFLLDCVAQTTGRDAQLLLVAGTPVIRVLLDVSRISSVVSVFHSKEDALAYPKLGEKKTPNESPATNAQQSWSA